MTKQDDGVTSERGLNLGPLGLRHFRNLFGWGVTVWLGKLSLGVSWDR
jgi:hypothetical protein